LVDYLVKGENEGKGGNSGNTKGFTDVLPGQTRFHWIILSMAQLMATQREIFTNRVKELGELGEVVPPT